MGAPVWSIPFSCACASACFLASAAVPPLGVASCESFWPLAGACHTNVSQSQDYLRLTTTMRTSSIGTYRLRELLLHISVGREKLTCACSASNCVGTLAGLKCGPAKHLLKTFSLSNKRTLQRIRNNQASPCCSHVCLERHGDRPPVLLIVYAGCAMIEQLSVYSFLTLLGEPRNHAGLACSFRPCQATHVHVV